MSKKTYIGIFIRVDLTINDVDHDSKECPNGHVIQQHIAKQYCGDCGVMLTECKIPDTDIVTTWDLYMDGVLADDDYNSLLVVTNVRDHTVRVDKNVDKVEHLIIRGCNGFYLDQYDSTIALDHTAVNGQVMVKAFADQYADLIGRLKPHYKDFKIMYGVLQYYE
ncbi:MAG: hypothetical protein DRJ15_10100 [Bacteroidetes bacterium]|nr:MAG: hypothetical protein DRJ15_10100 [Bacteroidota bacterium]